MPITVKYDLLGSQHTRGVTTNLYDRATIRAYVEGIANTNLGVGDAIQAVISETTRRFHQFMPSLPLAYVSGRRHGKDSAMLVLQYGRRSFNTRPSNPGQVASFRSATWATQWYKLPYTPSTGAAAFANGQIPANANLVVPNGPLQFHNGVTAASNGDRTAKPKAYVWEQKCTRMFVPTVLPNNPLPTIAGKLNTINSSNSTYGGMTFPRDTLLFEAFEADWYEEQNGTALWVVNYVFLHARNGFVFQNAEYDPDQFGGVWVTKQGLAFEESSFTGFPL